MRYILILLLLPCTLFAQTFGPNSPVTAANVTGIGTNAWGNPNNIFTSNNNRSTINTNGISNYLVGTNYGFNLAATDIVQGIQVDIEKSVSASGVALLGSWTVGTTRTRPAGNNRCMIVIVALENEDPRDVTAISYGGRSLTQLSEVDRNTNFYAKIEAWYLLESDLAAATNTTISVTYGATTLNENFEIIAAAIYSNVDQTSTFNDSEIASLDGGAATIQFPSLINTLPGSISVTGIFSGNPPNPAQALGNATAFTINSGFTETIDYHAANASFSSSGGALEIAQKASTATGTEQPSFTFSGTANRRVMIGFSLRRAEQKDNSVRLFKGGNVGGNDNATIADWPVTDTYITYGGIGDLWGLTWTPTDINNSNFGAGISAALENATLRVDHMRITVYTMSVLPLELVHFTATRKQSSIFCSWITASEKNTDYFELERSADGITFTPIGKLNGAGESQSPLTYHFEDIQPLQGINYYRLRMVDNDGGYEYTDVVSELFLAEGDAMVYPNPAADWTTILVPDGFEEIIITDAQGHIVDQFEGSTLQDHKELNVQQMPDGTYFVWIKTADGITQVKQLLKTSR